MSVKLVVGANASICIYAEGKTIYSQKVKLEVTPELLQACKHLYPAFEKAHDAASRSPEEWVRRLEEATTDTFLLSWAASVIWFQFDGTRGTCLYRLMETLDPTLLEVERGDVDELLHKVGYPENICFGDAHWKEKLRQARSKIRASLDKPVIA